MISDFVKGKKKFEMPLPIQQGIELHRAIDAFTDQHQATAAAKEIFKPHYRLYAGPLVDVVFDFYVAHTAFKSAEELMLFSEKTYHSLSLSEQSFPPVFSTVFFYMRTQNWLYYYREDEGIRKSLQGLMRRSRYLVPDNVAYELFLSHKNELEKHFLMLWPQLVVHASHIINSFAEGA